MNGRSTSSVHLGGAFERLIQSTKRCLHKLIARAHLSFDELLTMITEIEAVLNSRPLSYVSGEDIDEPLTPSHLLVGCTRGISILYTQIASSYKMPNVLIWLWYSIHLCEFLYASSSHSVCKLSKS